MVYEKGAVMGNCGITNNHYCLNSTPSKVLDLPMNDTKEITGIMHAAKTYTGA